MQVAGLFFPLYRLVIVLVAVVIAIALWLMVDWTRLGAMIRAGVDDAPIARVVGIKVSQLFTLVFALGAALAAFGGVMGAPYLSVYPGLDFEMLPLALIVVILGGTGSLLGALVGSFLIGFLYNFGQAMFPDLAYVILFLPMLLVLVLRPQGLFGKVDLVNKRTRASSQHALVALALLLPAARGRQCLLHQLSPARFCLFAVLALALNVLVGYARPRTRSAMPACLPWRGYTAALLLAAGLRPFRRRSRGARDRALQPRRSSPCSPCARPASVF